MLRYDCLIYISLSLYIDIYEAVIFFLTSLYNKGIPKLNSYKQAWGQGVMVELEEAGKRVQTFSYKMTMISGSKVKYGDYR